MSTIYWFTTDGTPICKDCCFWNFYMRKCVIRANEISSTLYLSSCTEYIRK